MKNIRVLYEPEEIRQYFREHFKTKLVREEMDKPGSFVNKIVEKAAEYPLFLYEFSDHPSKDTPDKEKTEWAHFGAWWGGITAREYSNDAISDAYYLHEMYHKGFMTYDHDLSFEGWKDKMFRNELNASVASELELYFNHPEFRKQTFEHEILADRFLRDERFMRRWKNAPESVHDEILLKRREYMLRENKNDPVEYWIHKFSQQNEAWAATWSRRYNQVESKMKELHDAIDDGVPRKVAMDKFMAWLQSQEISENTEIPFPYEAEAFAGVYRSNNHHYIKSIAKGDLKPEKALDFIRNTYPTQDPKKALAGPIATEVMGKVPDYSGRDDYHVLGVTGVTAGSFAIPYFIDMETRNPDTNRMGEIMLVLQKRGDKGLGAFGGYTSVDDNLKKNHKKEQPDEGCARECSEESKNDQGIPILAPDPSRLVLLDAGIDYHPDPATSYIGYELKLDSTEMTTLKEHGRRLTPGVDDVYAKAAYKQSNGEVKELLILPLGEALKMGSEQFTHPHEFKAIEKLAERLKERSAVKETGRV